jgi:hypothetical protein
LETDTKWAQAEVRTAAQRGQSTQPVQPPGVAQPVSRQVVQQQQPQQPGNASVSSDALTSDPMGEARIVAGDLICSNGVIHLVSAQRLSAPHLVATRSILCFAAVLTLSLALTFSVLLLGSIVLPPLSLENTLKNANLTDYLSLPHGHLTFCSLQSDLFPSEFAR